MGILDRIFSRNVKLENIEPNKVFNVGKDDISAIQDPRSRDWVELAPRHIKPTIKNCRRAAKTPTVYGILNNLILKTISSFTIDGTNQDAIEHIIDRDEEWNLKNLAYEVLWKNLVDGECFYEYIIEDRSVRLRGLAFDGEKYLIKKLYDPNAELMGYMQWVLQDSKLKDWKNKEYWQIMQSKEQKTVSFMPDEVCNPIFIEIDGVGQSMVKNVIDLAYYLESMNTLMPSIVHKSANVMVATIGNENRKETKIDKEARDDIAQDLSNYHSKGVITVPYGISLDVVGDNVLPNIQNYINNLKSQIFIGLCSPESIYSSESSNRSTAQVQMDSKTGYMLLIELLQEFLKRFIEKDLIDKELELNNFEKGCVYLDFMTKDEDLDTNSLEKGDHVPVNVDETPNGNLSTALTREEEDKENGNGKPTGKSDMERKE